MYKICKKNAAILKVGSKKYCVCTVLTTLRVDGHTASFEVMVTMLRLTM